MADICLDFELDTEYEFAELPAELLLSLEDVRGRLSKCIISSSPRHQKLAESFPGASGAVCGLQAPPTTTLVGMCTTAEHCGLEERGCPLWLD